MDESKLVRIVDNVARFSGGEEYRIPKHLEVFENRQEDGTYRYLFSVSQKALQATHAESGTTTPDAIDSVCFAACVRGGRLGVRTNHFTHYSGGRVYFIDGSSYPLPPDVLMVPLDGSRHEYAISRETESGEVVRGVLTAGQRWDCKLIRDLGLADLYESIEMTLERLESARSAEWCKGVLAEQTV